MTKSDSILGMSFGVVAGMRTVDVVEEVAIAAEESGFDLFGVGDSQSLGGDVYVHLAAAARVTERIRISTCVTNTVTRHPAVTANAIATVDRISDGRAVLGVSIGDSAVLNLGLSPMKLDGLGRDIVAMRGLMAGEEVEVRGGTARLKAVTRSVPIYMAAEGPRALHLAGQVADGVFAGVGLGREHIEMANRSLRQGMEAAGRSLEDVEVWHMARCVVDDEPTNGIKRLRPALASIGHHGLTTNIPAKHVPPEVAPRLQQLKLRYRTDHHTVPGESPNALLIDELNLVDYLAERYAIVGDPEACAQRVLDLAGRGVRNLLLTVVDADPAAVVRRFGNEVVPIVRERLATIAQASGSGGEGA